jgi:hypothetical protein
MMKPIGYEVRATKRPKAVDRWQFYGPGAEEKARAKAKSISFTANREVWAISIVGLY